MASNFGEEFGAQDSGRPQSNSNVQTGQQRENNYFLNWRKEKERQLNNAGSGGKCPNQNNQQGRQYRGSKYRNGWQRRDRGWYRGRGQQPTNSSQFTQSDGTAFNRGDVSATPRAGPATESINDRAVETNDVEGSDLKKRDSGESDKKKRRCEWNPQIQPYRIRKRNKFVGQNNKKTANGGSALSFEINTGLPFEKQAIDLIKQVEQTEENTTKAYKVLNDLKYIFGAALTDVQPQMFGSTLSKLAFKTSDLDAFLYCPNGQPEYNFVQEKGSLIYRGKKFTNIVRLGNARVPVIKAQHVVTGVNVDITITSRVGVMNSLMLKFLVEKGDPRIRQLLMLILLWAKLACVSGVNRLSSYTLCLMTIFYLQQLEPCLLPPLHVLVKPTDGLSWPMEFTEDRSLLETENSTELKDLFGGFFGFYSKFDFGENVIAPFSAKIIPCSSFVDFEALPECYSHYKKMARMCDKKFPVKSSMHVQEPLDLTANTAHSVSRANTEMINSTCCLVVDFLDSFSEMSKLDLLFKFASVPVYKEHSILITFNAPEIDSDRLIRALRVTFKDVFLIQTEEVNEGGAKRPSAPENTYSNGIWFVCTTWCNPLFKSRTSAVKALTACSISNFAKEMIISRYVLSQWNKKYNFKALVRIKCLTDGTANVLIVDTFNGKSNHFKEISRSLQVHLRHYVMLALEENDLVSLTVEIDKLFPCDKKILNLSILKDYVESKYSPRDVVVDNSLPLTSGSNIDDGPHSDSDKSQGTSNKFPESVEPIEPEKCS